jgi:NAD(P)-dependent dehydrogenase (short-subunit alcohol dehydrogenase family)
VLSVPGPIDASKLLRPGLLEGVSMLIVGVADSGADSAGDGSHSLAQTVGSACTGLGARVSTWQPGDAPDAGTDLLVIDAAGAFAREHVRGAPGGQDASRAVLQACLDGAWEATRAVANTAFIDPARAGRIVYLAPALGTAAAELAQHAEAARAGLENLARTLSIEWARHGITTVAIAPGAHSRDEELAALVAYLGSAAGAYFSGCLLDLRGPGGR